MFDTLYQGTDYLALNWFERQWVAWYVFIGDPALATGLATFILHEVCVLSLLKKVSSNLGKLVYFGRSIPWIIIDAMPYFRRWKLQPTKIPTAAEQWECTRQVLISHFMIELPLVWCFL